MIRRGGRTWDLKVELLNRTKKAYNSLVLFGVWPFGGVKQVELFSDMNSRQCMQNCIRAFSGVCRSHMTKQQEIVRVSRALNSRIICGALCGVCVEQQETPITPLRKAVFSFTVINTPTRCEFSGCILTWAHSGILQRLYYRGLAGETPYNVQSNICRDLSSHIQPLRRSSGQFPVFSARLKADMVTGQNCSNELNYTDLKIWS